MVRVSGYSPAAAHGFPEVMELIVVLASGEICAVWEKQVDVYGQPVLVAGIRMTISHLNPHSAVHTRIPVRVPVGPPVPSALDLGEELRRH